jgi:LacI family transcriptional regulator
MKRTQIPIVLIDSYCNDHYYHNIRIDDAYGSYLATRHLLENGHGRSHSSWGRSRKTASS